MNNIALHVLENLLEGCQIIGPDWSYLYVNDSVVRQGKLPRERLLGRTMMECYPGIEDTEMFAVLRQCMAERVHRRMENEFRFPDGSRGWFELRFVPVDEGVCILSLDITERKRSEEVLRRANEDLHLLFDGVRDHAIYMIDPRGRVTSWNVGAERLHGYTAEEIVGSDGRCFYTPEDLESGKLDEGMAAALARGRFESEGWGVRKGGAKFWANTVITPLMSHGEHVGFAMVTRDLTERRKLEAQFFQSQKMEAVGRLAGGIAHDFSNMLSVVLSYTAMMLDELPEQDPLRQDLEEIEKAGKRATALSRQLLAFSRQQTLSPQVVDLNRAVQGMARMLARVLGEDIELKTFLCEAPWKVNVDVHQIEQVVMNLAVNARDAMPNGGHLTIETDNVEIDAHFAEQHLGMKPGPHVMLAVSDSGCGMDAATRERIFEPFFTTKEVGKGTGLGLSTVFGIVQQSGGSVWVYSEPGQGTTFKIYFPKTTREASSSAPPPRAVLRRGVEKILVVDDEPQLRALIEGILRKRGLDVLAAASPIEALALSGEHAGKIGLLLTDVVMPVMNGRQLAERMTLVQPGMRVLYMSGYTGNVVVHHGVLDEGVAFLQKPITPDALLRAIELLLDVPAL